MSIRAIITRPGPGHMYDVDLYNAHGLRLLGYGSVYYTLRGARRGAKRYLKRAMRDLRSEGYREVIHP